MFSVESVSKNYKRFQDSRGRIQESSVESSDEDNTEGS
jgi:hypothetical protein